MVAFELEIRKQIDTALRAYARIKKVCATRYEGPLNTDLEAQLTMQVQDDLHAFFSSVGVIAKILDPHPKKISKFYDQSLARGEALRNALQVGLKSKILDRSVRDGLEHIDERIDEYLETNPSVIYESWIIERVGHDERLNTRTVMRYFDSSSSSFRLVNATGNLDEFAKELEGLRNRLTTQGHILAISLENVNTGQTENTVLLELPVRDKG